MLPPKGFTQHLSKDAYVEAAVIVSKKSGVLRFTWPVIMGAAALTVFGGAMIARNVTMPAYWISGGLALLAAAWLLGMWLAVFPNTEKTKAREQYALYEQLYGQTTVTFTSDDMTVKGHLLTRCVDYAKTRLCVETAERYIIFTDDGAAVILEKANFEEAAATDAFLRDVFARWYTGKRGA